MPIFIAIATSLARSLAENFITSGEFLKWTKLALNVIDSGVDVEGRLKNLETSIAARLDKGEHFQESDFDVVVSRITKRDQRWADL
jgi:hypothetical protein